MLSFKLQLCVKDKGISSNLEKCLTCVKGCAQNLHEIVLCHSVLFVGKLRMPTGQVTFQPKVTESTKPKITVSFCAETYSQGYK